MRVVLIGITLLFFPLMIPLSVEGVNGLWPLIEIKRQLDSGTLSALLNFLKVISLTYLLVAGICFALQTLIDGFSFKKGLALLIFFAICHPLFCAAIYLLALN